MKKLITVCLALMLLLTCAFAEQETAPAVQEAETAVQETETAAQTVQAGDFVIYGHYEQDNDTANGAEPLEWVVLDVQDGKALLLTRYCVDSLNYHPGEREKSFPTWEKSFIREWLNSEFIAAAFTQEEADAIQLSTLANPSYKKYNYGGPDTQDTVFLLSRDEVEQYFPTYDSRMCTPTAYALARGAWVSTKYELDGVRCTWWWLRTPGYYRSCAASVRTRGTITSNRVYDASGTVRPAIWVDAAAL